MVLVNLEQFRWARLWTAAYSATHDVNLRNDGIQAEGRATSTALQNGMLTICFGGIAVYQFIRLRFVVGRRIHKLLRGVPLKRDEVPALWTLLDGVAKTMDVSLSKFSLYWIDDASISASVIGVGKRVQLFVPSGLIVMASSRPPVAEAGAAHELAHVQLKDTRLWLFAVSAQQALQKSRWLALALSLPGMVWFLRFGSVRVALFLICLSIGPASWLYIFSIEFVFWARERSELLADSIAARFVGKRSIAEAIDLTVASGPLDGNVHPPREIRIASLERL